MRQALTWRTTAATVAAVATIAALLVLHPWRRDVPPPQEPVVTFEQDAAGVHVHVHNANAHWGLRDQPMRVLLLADGGFPIRGYFPNEIQTIDGKPGGRTIQCCTVALLPPHGDYSFDLFPTHETVAGVDIQLRGGRYWVRM